MPPIPKVFYCRNCKKIPKIRQIGKDKIEINLCCNERQAQIKVDAGEIPIEELIKYSITSKQNTIDTIMDKTILDGFVISLNSLLIYV